MTAERRARREGEGAAGRSAGSTPESIPDNAVRAQYTAGYDRGQAGAGLPRGAGRRAGLAARRRSPRVRLFIDNWRWNGVPFYLRSGKRLTKRVSEIAVQFRAPPHLMFGHRRASAMRPNTLVMRVQPNEGVSLQLRGEGAGRRGRAHVEHRDRAGGHGLQLRRGVRRDDGAGVRDAAARRDDRRGDAVHAQRRGRGGVARGRSAHRLLGQQAPDHMPTYAAGTWGPEEADEFIAREGAAWRRP